MQHTNELPPNFNKIKEAFPSCEKERAVFCYGEVLHSPFGAIITRDLEVHEAVHSKQQGSDPEAWWDRYIADKDWRLEQEIEAYGVQLYFIKQNNKRTVYDYFLNKITEMLSGQLYGNIILEHQASSRLRHFIKKI